MLHDFCPVITLSARNKGEGLNSGKVRHGFLTEETGASETESGREDTVR
jgi:hypothetical protein